MNKIKAYHCNGDGGGQPLHCHEEVEFVAVYQGQGRFQVGRSRHATGPGVFSVVCPQEPHGGVPTSADFAVKVLNVSAEWFSDSGWDWRSLWHKGAVCKAPFALAAFLKVYETVQGNRSSLVQEEALLTLCDLIHGKEVSPMVNLSEAKPVERAIELLRERFADDISLAELAASVGLAPAYLCRVFTSTIGLPPHAYQIRLRVARAKTLIERGKSPSEAAFAVGFYDQSHLNLHFKRLFGVTPSSVAKSSVAKRPISSYRLP